ncbi:MAG TPA: alanine--glyoxylate aminotransferase family protein [Gemmatimonadales bacterium]|nr:alanine--glyoxylate aminotransferase family protein [Gemmatimonadales bacterium]
MSAPFGRFFLPGPTEVLPEVLEAQLHPMIGHRGAATEALLRAVDQPLRSIFRTSRPVIISTSSATGLMEAAIRNGVRRRVLCLVNGAFSQRFADIAVACGKEAVVARVEPGRTFEADQLKQLLSESGADAVTLVHSESATGALNPLQELAAVVREADDVMLLVDGVTSVGGSPVETDAWGLDFVLTGSQKALALPPGLAFGVASERLLERARTLPARGIYFDLVPYVEQAAKHQTPYTPAISTLYTLHAQLGRLQANGGIEARWAAHRAMLECAERWIADHGASLGLEYLPAAGRRSWTVSCFRLLHAEPTGGAIAKRMEARGFTIAPGYGKLKDTTIRIGHMGDHTVAHLEECLAQLMEVLKRG